MDQVFARVAEKCRKADFLEAVREKAHYSEEDRELFWDVAERILGCMESGAQVSARDLHDEHGAAYAQEVVMTLGVGVDDLQEDFLQKGQITEAYMVEVLGSEILLQAYSVYNAWVKEQGEYAVKRYHFLGTDVNFVREKNKKDEKDSAMVNISAEAEKDSVAEEIHEDGISLRLEVLPELLERSGLPVTCTEGYCMVPKKSVAFYAELTKEKTITCEGICMGCGRVDCPNRMASSADPKGNRMLDRPLTYGYARILGL